MTKFSELEAEIGEKTEEVVALLKTIDEQVEVLFEGAKDPEVPESFANTVRSSMQRIKDEAGKIATDDSAGGGEEPPPV